MFMSNASRRNAFLIRFSSRVFANMCAALFRSEAEASRRRRALKRMLREGQLLCRLIGILRFFARTNVLF
jgi:hypothetical protein